METLYKEKISTVHAKHKTWFSQLALHKEELKIFQKWLEEFSSKNSNKDLKIFIEQFQNRFLIQRNELDGLKHLININEDEAVEFSQMHVRRISIEATNQFCDIDNAMMLFEKLFKELKNDLYDFLIEHK